MLKYLVHIAFFLCLQSQAQSVAFSTFNGLNRVEQVSEGIAYRGMGGYGGLDTDEIDDYGHMGTAAEWKTYHLIIAWSDIETSDNVFNWTATDAKIAEIKAAGLYVGVQISVSPTPNYPTYLIALVGEYTTDRDTYPQYYHTTYVNRYHRMLTTAAAHFASVGVTYWSIVEGTTGDQGPDHGTLTCCVGDPDVPQNGSDDTWEAFRRTAWDIAAAALVTAGNDSIRMMINSGNDFQNLDDIIERYPGVMGKDGALSHHYVLDGHSLYDVVPYITTRGEVQGEILTSDHGVKDAMELSIIAVATRLSILNTPTGYWNQLLSGDLNETRPAEFFNRYANDTTAFYSNDAFIHLGTLLGIDDIARWDEATYGDLISDQGAYDAAVAAVNGHAGLPPPGWGDAYKLYQVMNRTITWTDAARITDLETTNGVGALNDYGGVIDWDNDFAYLTVDNWSKWITQNNSLTTSTPGYRGGSDTSIFGRFYKTATADLSFDINDNWGGGVGVADVTMSVVYLNNNTAVWTIQADTGSGMVDVATTENTGDGKWTTKTITINSMQLGTAEDFKIHKTSGSNISFTLIEIAKALE